MRNAPSARTLDGFEESCLDNSYKVTVITNSGQHINAVVETGVKVRLTFGRIVPRAKSHRASNAIASTDTQRSRAVACRDRVISCLTTSRDQTLRRKSIVELAN